MLTDIKTLFLWLLSLALVAGCWKFWQTADRTGYARSQAEYQARAELQREANRGRVRRAEEKQATQTVFRDRYITKTVKEIEFVTRDLASCPLPLDAVRLLNDTAKCASEDRSASCGADGGMHPTR